MILILFAFSAFLVAYSTGAACYLWAKFVDRAMLRYDSENTVLAERFWLGLLLTLVGWVVIVTLVALAIILVSA